MTVSRRIEKSTVGRGLNRASSIEKWRVSLEFSGWKFHHANGLVRVRRTPFPGDRVFG